MIIRDFQSDYGSLMGQLGKTGTFWRGEPVFLGEPVRTDIIHSLFYRGIYYFAKPNKGTV